MTRPLDKKPFNKRLKYNAIYYSIKLFLFLALKIPRVLIITWLGWLGSLAYYVVVGEREKVIRHLKFAYGEELSEKEVIKTAKGVFKMAGKNLGDILFFLKIDTLEKYLKYVKVEGQEHLDAAFQKGKGVVAFTGHIGAFEVAATYLAVKGYNPHVIGTKLHDEKINDLVLQYRTSRGAVAVERGKDNVKLLRALLSNGILGILIDQDTRVKSIFVDFYGKPAFTPVGATLLAHKTGAAIIPMFIQMQPDNSQIMYILPEIEKANSGDEEKDYLETTQKMNDCIEAFIRRDPRQWVWMHERWKTQPTKNQE